MAIKSKIVIIVSYQSDTGYNKTNISTHWLEMHIEAFVCEMGRELQSTFKCSGDGGKKNGRMVIKVESGDGHMGHY